MKLFLGSHLGVAMSSFNSWLCACFGFKYCKSRLWDLSAYFQIKVSVNDKISYFHLFRRRKSLFFASVWKPVCTFIWRDLATQPPVNSPRLPRDLRSADWHSTAFHFNFKWIYKCIITIIVDIWLSPQVINFSCTMTEVKVKKESTDPVDIENRWVQRRFNMRVLACKHNITRGWIFRIVIKVSIKTIL